MSKFSSGLKGAIFVWGIISGCLVVILAITVAISAIESHTAIEDPQGLEYKKTFDSVELKIQEKSINKLEGIFVCVSKSGKTLINDYRLPIEQIGLKSLPRMDDSTIIPINDNEYRVILFSSYHECEDESSDYVWLLKLANNRLSLVHVINLSDLQRIDGSECILWGNKHFSGSFQDLIIPVEVHIGDTIKTMPLLNHRGLQLIKTRYETEASKRMEKLSKSNNPELLVEHEAEMTKFKEILSGKDIVY